jgi:ACS family tartrate transporter-like MFS transporter
VNVEGIREGAERAVFRKAAWRLIPFLGLLYFVSFLDRVNVGFAALTMNQDLGLSASAYGIGAGIFFLGYFLFEVPSNLVLARVGARRWISRILLTWGALSVAMAFVTGPVSFWIVRFLLGAAEAGFFPGMVLYLTYWFPNAARGRIMGWFFIAIPLSSAFGAPLSTWLLGFEPFGLRGWQAMFILEGLPAVLLGIVVLARLPDGPRQARWLDPAEVATVEAMLARERTAGPAATLRRTLLRPAVWHFAAIYFGIVVGLYGFGFWAPQIIKSLGDLSNSQVGLIATAPYLTAAVAMYFWSARSDAVGERRWHTALPAFVGAAGFAVSALLPDPVLRMAAFTLGAIGIYAALPVFWTLPTAALTGRAAAGGIALVNAIGNLGGYLGPVFVGRLKELTGGYDAGMLAIAVAMAVSGVLAVLVRRPLSGNGL